MSKGNGSNGHMPGEGNPKKVKVLLYHRILSNGQSEDSADIGVSIEKFRRQMKMLDRWGYTSITFDDFRLFLEGELNLPKKPVIITFDDAYTDIYDLAAPILREYGMKAVVFVVGDMSLRESIWDRSVGPVHSLLNKSQILALHDEGFEIGSHTLSHPKLPNLGSDRAWEELHKSRIILEILLDSPVKSFAYPYGLVNARVKQMAHDSGYTVACGAYTGPPLFGDDYLEVRRIMVKNSANSLQFWFQLQPAYLYYRWLVWKTKSRLLRFLRKNPAGDFVGVRHANEKQMLAGPELLETSQ